MISCYFISCTHTHTHLFLLETFFFLSLHFLTPACIPMYPASLHLHHHTQTRHPTCSPPHRHHPLSPPVFSFRWGVERGLIRRQRFFVFQPLQNVKNVWLPAEYQVGREGGRESKESLYATTGKRENGDDNSGQATSYYWAALFGLRWLLGSQVWHIALLRIQELYCIMIGFHLTMITLVKVGKCLCGQTSQTLQHNKITATYLLQRASWMVIHAVKWTQ